MLIALVVMAFVGAVLFNISVPLPVVAGAIVVGLLWWISLQLWPEKRCWRCRGGGSLRGPVHLRRRCGNCGGSGRVTRIGGKP